MPKAFTQLQKETAFDKYYAMGAERDLKVLGRDLVGTQNFEERAPKHKTLRNWSRSDNWQERVKLRDIENSKKQQTKTDQEVVNTKADYRKMIKERLGELRTEKGYLTKAYATAKKKLEDGTLEVGSVKELTELSRAMQGLLKAEESMMKTDLLMMGEADSRTETNIAQAIMDGTYYKES